MPVWLGLKEGVKVPLSVLVGVGEGLGEGVPGVGSTIRNMRTPTHPAEQGPGGSPCTVYRAQQTAVQCPAVVGSNLTQP
jgi:hypothetical protein